jgi:hypothetical protein
VSLGHYEKDDLQIVLEFVTDHFNFKKLGVWGRSMGAATCLLHKNAGNMVSAYLLDSPFNSIIDVCMAYARNKLHLPDFITNFALKYIRDEVLREADFDIYTVNPQN